MTTPITDQARSAVVEARTVLVSMYGSKFIDEPGRDRLTPEESRALRTILASHAAQAERIASLEAGLGNLVRDSLANDFNNCWDSYTDAVALLSGKASA